MQLVFPGEDHAFEGHELQAVPEVAFKKVPGSHGLHDNPEIDD